MAKKKSMQYAGSAEIDSDYRAECDLRSLIEAEKIEKDPARYKAALSKRKAMMADLESIVTEKE